MFHFFINECNNNMNSTSNVNNTNQNIKNNTKQTINETLKKLLDKKCTHATYYGKKDEEYVCIQVMREMSSAFHNKLDIDNNLVNKFWINYLLGCCYIGGNTYYSRYSNNNNITLQFIEQLCLYKKPSSQVLKELLKHRKIDMLYGYIILGENFTKFDENDVHEFISRLKYVDDGDNNLSNIIINNVEETVPILSNLILAKSTVIADWVYDKIVDLNLLDNSYKKNVLFPTIQNNICQNIDYHQKLFKHYADKGLEFTEDHEFTICSHGNIESINLVYQSLRFEVTRGHFNSVCLSREISINHHMTQTTKSTYKPEKAELMFKYGYKLDVEDVRFIICNKVMINDIDRFGLELGREILTLCGKKNFYPTYNFSEFDAGLIELYQLTQKKNVGNLQRFYKTKKTVPDAICMNNACSLNYNVLSYNVLKKHGGEVTYKNVEKVAEKWGSTFMKTVVNDYKEVINGKDNQIRELKKEINNLKKEVNSLKNNKNNQDQSNSKTKFDVQVTDKSILQIMDTIQKDNELFRLQQEQFKILMNNHSKDQKSNQTIEKIPTKIINNKQSNNKSNTTNQPKIPINKKTKNSKKDSDKSINFDISDEVILKTKDQYRYLSDIPQSVKSIDLNLNEKVSYSDLKIHVMNHFRDKKWIHDNLIKLPLDAKLLLDITDGNCINIEDIDKFITYLYRMNDA